MAQERLGLDQQGCGSPRERSPRADTGLASTTDISPTHSPVPMTSASSALSVSRWIDNAPSSTTATCRLVSPGRSRTSPSRAPCARCPAPRSLRAGPWGDRETDRSATWRGSGMLPHLPRPRRAGSWRGRAAGRAGPRTRRCCAVHRGGSSRYRRIRAPDADRHRPVQPRPGTGAMRPSRPRTVRMARRRPQDVPTRLRDRARCRLRCDAPPAWAWATVLLTSSVRHRSSRNSVSWDSRSSWARARSHALAASTASASLARTRRRTARRRQPFSSAASARPTVAKVGMS